MPSTGLTRFGARDYDAETGVGVVETAGEAEGLEAGIAVLDHLAPDVVVQLLDDGARVGVDDQADAAEVVVDEAVERAAAFPLRSERWRVRRRGTRCLASVFHTFLRKFFYPLSIF